MSQWAWTLSILGAAHCWLDYSTPTLRYASEAAMPFYILHLPVLTLAALVVTPLSAGVLVEYTLVVVLSTLATEQDVPGVTAERFQPHLAAEAAAVWALVQAGLITFEAIPLRPYPGFARLFGSTSLDARRGEP